MKFAFRTAPSAPPHPGAFGFRQRGGQQRAWLRPKHGCGLLPVPIVFVLSSDEGVRDFDKYKVDPAARLMPDFFVPESSKPPPGVVIG